MGSAALGRPRALAEYLRSVATEITASSLQGDTFSISVSLFMRFCIRNRESDSPYITTTPVASAPARRLCWRRAVAVALAVWTIASACAAAGHAARLRLRRGATVSVSARVCLGVARSYGNSTSSGCRRSALILQLARLLLRCLLAAGRRAARARPARRTMRF
eukprot:SAG31_NODE_2516_length_5580_cov_5.787448_2_plen_163_part_00